METVLQPNMCITMEPMIVIPADQAGAGGYREHNIHIVTEEGNEDITGFPFWTGAPYSQEIGANKFEINKVCNLHVVRHGNASSKRIQ